MSLRVRSRTIGWPVRKIEGNETLAPTPLPWITNDDREMMFLAMLIMRKYEFNTVLNRSYGY